MNDEMKDGMYDGILYWVCNDGMNDVMNDGMNDGLLYWVCNECLDVLFSSWPISLSTGGSMNITVETKVYPNRLYARNVDHSKPK